MSSKFFGDSDNEGSDNETVAVAAPVAPKAAKSAKSAKTTKTSNRHRRDEEEEEDDVKRVVVSQKDKAQKEINSGITSIQSWISTNDWNSINNEFANITKLYQKAAKKGEVTPEYYIEFLVTLDDAVTTLFDDKEAKKSLRSNQAKGLSSLNNVFKKYIKPFEPEMEAYRESHAEEEVVYEEEIVYEEVEEGEDVEYEEVYEEVYEEEEEAVEEEAEEEEIEEEEVEEEAEEEEEYEEEEEAEEEEEKEEEEIKKPAAADGRVPRGRAFWLKSNSGDSDSDSDDDDFNLSDDDEDDKKPSKKGKSSKDKKAEKKEEKKEALAKKVSEAEEKRKLAAAARAAAAAGGKEDEFTLENINKRLGELILKRGKKNFDRKEQTEKLNQLADNAKSPEQEITIVFHLISTLLDISAISFLTLSQWRNCSKHTSRIFAILSRNKHINLVDKIESFGQENDEEEDSDVVKVGGRSQLILTVERLEDELTKSFQNVEPHSREYLDRLKDENVLLEILATAQEFFSGMDFAEKQSVLSRFVIRRIEHSYYKINPAGLGNLASLCGFLYANGDARLKTRAVLCHIYALAIHDQFYLARDILLKTHLQESIHHMDAAAQIQLNRVVAQLGLCAFRKGLVWEAHSCLADFYSGNTKAKELLAQGVPRYQDRNPLPQDLIERLEKKLVPYHMHISLDMLECAHLTSAMLLEVPNMAATNNESKRKVISRPFRKNLEHLERNVFSGPPETTRDYVMVAAKSLANGDWRKCRDLINGLSVWSLISGSDQVKTLLTKKIQEEGLFTYLLRFGSSFDSISIETLAETFELPHNKVFSIVAKMIGNEDLSASLDGPTSCIIMHKSEASRIQSLALLLTEKAHHLVELNERIFELKSGAVPANQRNEANSGSSAAHNQTADGGKANPSNRSNNQQNKGNQSNSQRSRAQNTKQGAKNSQNNRQGANRNQGSKNNSRRN